MSNIQQVDWISVRPAIPVTPRRGYIQIPTFDLTPIVAPDSSQIIIQYNYSVTKPFVLHRKPVPPTDVNWVACIRYRIGNTVYRYKLWEDVGEVLNVPLYTGQVILPNFCVEIWNAANISEATLDITLTIYLSIQEIPTSYREITNYVLSNASAPAILDNTNASVHPTPSLTGLSTWYKSDTGVTGSSPVSAWADQSGNANNLTRIAGNPTKVTSQINGYPCIRFPVGGGSNYLQSGSGVLSQLFCMVIAQQGWTANRKLLTKGVSLIQHTSANTLQWNGGTDVGPGMVTGTYYMVFIADGTMSILSIDAKNAIDSCPSTVPVLDLSNLLLGDSAATAQFDIAELLVYDANGNNVATINAATTYFANRYANQPVLSLPLTFDASSQWLDNTPIVPQLPI